MPEILTKQHLEDELNLLLNEYEKETDPRKRNFILFKLIKPANLLWIEVLDLFHAPALQSPGKYVCACGESFDTLQAFYGHQKKHKS